METYVKKSDVKRVIDHLIAGAKKSADINPEDILMQKYSECEILILKLAWGLINSQTTYKINEMENGKTKANNRPANDTP